MDINLGLAFLGGLASFFSPCVLSVMPLYIGYIGGRSFNHQNIRAEEKFRLTIFFHGLFFILGFSLVFITMGMTISVLGGYLVAFRWWIIRIAGAIILLFGLHLSGLLRIKWLDYELKFQPNFGNQNSVSTSFLLGVVFAAGWTPCIGPILGSILALTIQSGSIYNGLIYLIFYSIGMGIPFMATCFSVEWISTFIRKNLKATLYIEKSMGWLLIFMGTMMVIGFYDFIVQSFSYIRLG